MTGIPRPETHGRVGGGLLVRCSRRANAWTEALMRMCSRHSEKTRDPGDEGPGKPGAREEASDTEDGFLLKSPFSPEHTQRKTDLPSCPPSVLFFFWWPIQSRGPFSINTEPPRIHVKLSPTEPRAADVPEASGNGAGAPHLKSSLISIGMP